MAGELSAEEVKFFETGDASVLGLGNTDPDPEPVVETKIEPVAEPAEESEPDPVAELRARLASEQASRAQLEASIARLSEQIAAPKEPVAKAPDPTTDPLGSMMHQLAKVTETVTKLQEHTESQTKAQQEQQRFTEFVQNLSQQREAFAKTQTDFSDAYAHLRSRRADDLRDVGVPEAQIQQALLQDELAVSQNAVAQGKNPAAVIYNMAKRYGYTPKAAAPKAEEKIAQLKKGQDAATNPSKGDPTQELSFAGLKDASDSDLNKLVQDNKMWGNLVGGKSNDIF